MALKKEILLQSEYSHDFEYYDSLSQTYDFTAVMAGNTPVQM